jgi:hypothetical protein
MEPEGSLPRSQVPSTGRYPEPDRSNPYHLILSKIHFNIVHASTYVSTKLLKKSFKTSLPNLKTIKDGKF